MTASRTGRSCCQSNRWVGNPSVPYAACARPHDHEGLGGAERSEPLGDPVEVHVQRAAGVVQLVRTANHQQRSQVLECAHLTSSVRSGQGPTGPAQANTVRRATPARPGKRRAGSVTLWITTGHRSGTSSLPSRPLRAGRLGPGWSRNQMRNHSRSRSTNRSGNYSASSARALRAASSSASRAATLAACSSRAASMTSSIGPDRSSCSSLAARETAAAETARLRAR